MLNIAFKHSELTTSLLNQGIYDLNFQDKPIEEQVKISILKDLLNLNWNINIGNNKIEVTPPVQYNKKVIRQSMAVKRDEIIAHNRIWISKHINLARNNLAMGYEVLKSPIIPKIEICETRKQHNLFRIYRYYWSSPYSDYVGRRIKLIIRDYGMKSHPVIGIAALGSPIIHIPERDELIGWDVATRTKNLVYAMDAYVLGALPPYNYLLGGKLISYILASKEVRDIYKKKYQNQITLINKRKVSDLVGIFTTSLYGQSSQYNRIKFNDNLLYIPFGSTKGYGTLHLTEYTIDKMRLYLKEKGIEIGYKFGDGPSWRMRLIKHVGTQLGFDADFLLKHSFKRNIYFVPLADNSVDFLRGDTRKPNYFDWKMDDLVDYWKERWLENRKKNLFIRNSVYNFLPVDFSIL